MTDFENNFDRILELLDAPDNSMDLFGKYHKLLLEWNRRHNLISRSDESHIVRRHFIDSLCLLRMIDIPKNSRLLDLGTGAGFPGIPLKIVRPDLDLVLLEAKRKKGLFLRQLLSDLGLRDVTLFIGRAEESASQIPAVDMVCSRAVAEASTLLKWGILYIKPAGGSIIALKGPDAESELKSIPDRIGSYTIDQCRFLPVIPFPELDCEYKRFVIEIRPFKTC